MVGPFALFCAVIILAGWVYLIRDWIVSASWKTVPGIVRGVDMAADQRLDPKRPWRSVDGFRPIVRYAYDVDGQTYVGERFSATRGPFFDSQEATQTYLQRFPKQAQLSVRVDPGNPRQALLERRLYLLDALPGYLGLACLFVSLVG